MDCFTQEKDLSGVSSVGDHDLVGDGDEARSEEFGNSVDQYDIDVPQCVLGGG